MDRTHLYRKLKILGIKFKKGNKIVVDLNQASNAIRMISAKCIQLANSGHPGMPLGMADIATVLWTKYLKHNPTNPRWINRDRFVLSNGHGSMLLYSLLHLMDMTLT